MKSKQELIYDKESPLVFIWGRFDYEMFKVEGVLSKIYHYETRVTVQKDRFRDSVYSLMECDCLYQLKDARKDKRSKAIRDIAIYSGIDVISDDPTKRVEPTKAFSKRIKKWAKISPEFNQYGV